MSKKLIPFLFLTVFALSGTARADGSAPGSATEPAGARAVRIEQADPEKEYARLMAAYRKDLAAYEADPTIWTAAIPQPPIKPEVTVQSRVRP